MVEIQALIQCFVDAFGEVPAHGATTPGRVNLIGEHTDYNDGFVLPMAIDRQAIMIAPALNRWPLPAALPMAHKC